MEQLLIELKNCYGIKELKYDFDFSGNKRTYAIYAPNGVMKSSFAKTFMDLSKDEDSKDIIFPDRITVRTIVDELGNSISRENVFVIEPYNDKFSSDKISTLVVKKELKEEYDKIYKDLGNEKDEFIKKLKGVSQSSDCESELFDTFQKHDKESFFEILEECAKVINPKFPKYSFKYNDIFDKKGNVEKFLLKNVSELDEYIRDYDSLISTSTFFKKNDNSFGTYQAGYILESIGDDSFFDAGHFLKLADGTIIHSKDEYQTRLDGEIARISTDEKLLKAFQKIDKAIGGNVELRAFKSVIEKNNLLLIKLKDYQSFKREVWLGYLLELQAEVDTLLKSYSLKKKELQDIIDEAKKTKTQWEKAVGLFNERFKGLPFRLDIQNKEDVILKIDVPSIEFIFEDSVESISVTRGDLLAALSQGEKRALYLVNIIFEIEARRIQNIDTIFIIDDIADSFDYKNKYAIIEYLKDISEERNANFYQIILTHNFDFYRTISSRIIGNGGSDRKYKLHTIKNSNFIRLNQEKYQNNPFEHWKNNLHRDGSMLIASIPFVRNLAEYTGQHCEKDGLTSLLHIKNDSYGITIKHLEDIYKIVLKDKSSLVLPDSSEFVINVIRNQADIIGGLTDETIELEGKIVLSMAIRLEAEKFMINKINNPVFVNGITEYQTITLINEFKRLFPNQETELQLLEQVNLMTPENIHLNSFMYEPILDLSIFHLKSLYSKVKALNNP